MSEFILSRNSPNFEDWLFTLANSPSMLSRSKLKNNNKNAKK